MHALCGRDLNRYAEIRAHRQLVAREASRRLPVND
jgi:hypothetical protein